MKIGERIKYRREELKMSQEELALRLGYKTRSSINKIEKDASGLPQSKIVAIANALQTTPAYIMGWEEVQKNNSDIAAAVVKMRSDKDFLSVVKMLGELNAEQFASVKQMLSAFISR